MKYLKLCSVLWIVILSNCGIMLCAQDDYKYEIGGSAGLNFYMGTTNRIKLFDKVGPALGGIFRYNMDLRWSVKTNLFFGQISGDTSSSKNVFPKGQEQSFKRKFADAGAQIEMNLFNYSDQFQYLGTKKFTPYVLIGLGFTYATGEKQFFDINMPLGIGLKYKLKERLNLNFEFSFRKLFSDSFDVTKKNGFQLNDPYGVGSNLFKNNDWYSLSLFSLTWNFGARPCPCQNIE